MPCKQLKLGGFLRYFAAFYSIFLVSSLGLGKSASSKSRSLPSEESSTLNSLPIPDEARLLLAIHWEGRDIQNLNLAALAEIRAEFPNMPVIHFISPAYFLRSPHEALVSRQKIRMLARPGDQFGLALGGWRSLISRSQAIFRNGPTFWGNPLRARDCLLDCGLDIPIHIYPEEELSRIMDTGIETLETHGFGRPRALSVAGWVASKNVLEVASLKGFVYDFSGVFAEPLDRTIAAYPLSSWAKYVWEKPEVSFFTNKISIQSSSITEVAQAIPGMDYGTVQEGLNAYNKFKAAAAEKKSSNGETPVFQIVVQQETAHLAASRLQGLLRGIKKDHDRTKRSMAFWERPELTLSQDSGISPQVH